MLPPALQFELRPRRRRIWLRVALAAACVAMAATVAMCWSTRQAKVDQLEELTSRVLEDTSKVSSEAPPVAPEGAWVAAAAQDGKLFALTADARLLEIERCTAERVTVSRIVHDEAAGTTAVEAMAESADAVTALIECLNAGAVGKHRWRIASVASPVSGGERQALSVSLRYE
jgi:hypothetical protein